MNFSLSSHTEYIIEPFFGMSFLGSSEKLIGVTEVSNNFDTSKEKQSYTGVIRRGYDILLCITIEE